MSREQWLFNMLLNGVVEGLIIGLLALAITLVYAVARFPNAAAGDFMTFGAYVAKGIAGVAGSLTIGVIGAAGVTAALSVFFYLWVFRRLLARSHTIALVASIGVAYFVRNIMTLFTGHEPQVFDVPIVRAMRIGGLLVQPTDIAIGLAAIVCVLAVFGVLHLTSMGRRMRAVADNPDLARVSGIRSGRVMIMLWLMSGSICAVGGVLIGLKAVLRPELGWDLLLPGFAAAILGGFGSPVGAVVGGLAMGLAQEFAGPFVGYSYNIAISFAVILLLLLWRPNGIFGRVEAVR